MRERNSVCVCVNGKNAFIDALNQSAAIDIILSNRFFAHSISASKRNKIIHLIYVKSNQIKCMHCIVLNWIDVNVNWHNYSEDTHSLITGWYSVIHAVHVQYTIDAKKSTYTAGMDERRRERERELKLRWKPKIKDLCALQINWRKKTRNIYLYLVYYEIILSILHIPHSIDHFKLTCQFENVLFQHVNAIIGEKKSLCILFLCHWAFTIAIAIAITMLHCYSNRDRFQSERKNRENRFFFSFFQVKKGRSQKYVNTKMARPEFKIHVAL